jgi:hypothetical protein
MFAAESVSYWLLAVGKQESPTTIFWTTVFLDYCFPGLLPFRLKYAKSKEAIVEQFRLIIYLKTWIL